MTLTPAWSKCPVSMLRPSGPHPKPNRSPAQQPPTAAQRVRFGEEEQQNERALTYKISRSKRYDACSDVEQVKGIEPSYSAWEADVLPLNYTCVPYVEQFYYSTARIIWQALIFNIPVTSRLDGKSTGDFANGCLKGEMVCDIISPAIGIGRKKWIGQLQRSLCLCRLTGKSAPEQQTIWM